MILLARWAARDLFRHPITWIAALLLSGLWLFLLVFNPIGLTTQGASAGAQTKEIAYIGLLVGSTLGVSQLAYSLRSFRCRPSPSRMIGHRQYLCRQMLARALIHEVSPVCG